MAMSKSSRKNFTERRTERWSKGSQILWVPDRPLLETHFERSSLHHSKKAQG